MNANIKETIEQADSIALATVGDGGINVIPISVITVQGEEVHLYDFFMNKTTENIAQNPEVAMVCWTGFEGVQIKATVMYDSESEVFEAAVATMKEQFPDRTLKAVLRLTPAAIHDVAPGSLGKKLL